MAIIVTDNRIIVDECDSTTGWTGSNTVSLFTSEPTPIEATGNLGMVVSSATQNAYVTISAVDLSVELVYVWIFHRAELDTKANGGIMIQLGDGTNRVGFHVAGSDVDGFRHSNGPVGWQCVVLDGSNLPTQSTVFAGTLGGLNVAAITQIGVGFKTLVKSVGGVANCFWDIIRRTGPNNKGITITGGTSIDPATFEQIANEDIITANQKAHGIFRKLGQGLYGVQGQLTFGSASTATYFKDSDATVVFEDRGLSPFQYSINVASGSGVDTTFILGEKIGTGDNAGGSNGVSFIIPSGIGTGSTFTANSVDINTLNLYGCTFSGFGAGLLVGGTTSHEIIGCNFAENGSVNTANAIIRNCSISGYTLSTEAAFIWNTTTNIKNCTFTNNTNITTNASAIYHPATGTFTYDNLRFANNDFDVNNNSGGAIVINATNSANPGTFVNTSGGTTTINNPITFTVSNVLEDSEVRIITQSDLTELAGVENVSATPTDINNVTVAADPLNAGRFIVSYNYNFVSEIPIFVVVFNLQFQPLRLSTVLQSANATLAAFQIFDRQYDSGSIP